MRTKVYMWLLFLVFMAFGGKVYADPSGWAPSQMRGFYRMTNNGSSATHVVIVVVKHNPDLESRLGTYLSQFGQSGCTVAGGCLHIWSETGSSTLTAGTASEAQQVVADLQAQMAKAGCKLCSVDVVEAEDNTAAHLGNALETAAGKGDVVHSAYKFARSGNSTQVTQVENAFGSKALVSSTGDGAGTALFPADSIKGFGISRTAVVTDGNAPRLIRETLVDGRGGYTGLTKQAWEPSGFTSHGATFTGVIGTDIAIYTLSGGTPQWVVMSGGDLASSFFAGLLGAVGGAIVLPGDAVDIGQFFQPDDGSADANSNTPGASYNLAIGPGIVDFNQL